ncbi:HNH endonuclease signature motif containing protein [Nocardia mexicana]|uniref:HNH endonuclease signature motif containing protein n=1 Tax=Nocardia mexicana TaxID=279262 RepID=UPI0012F5096A|nr:HNH endonuclease signature motif containing protein [Nocardia mexicana]
MAVEQAEKIRLETMLYRWRRCQELELRVNPAFAGQSAATEIGVVLRSSQRQADREIDLGLALEHRLPHSRRAFGCGRIDLTKVQVICTELQNVDEELVAELEPRIVAYAETVDPARLKRAIRRWVLEADPAGQAERRKQAEQDRYVNVAAQDNGTAQVDAVLPAAGGQTLYARLREMANSQCCARDPRTTGQRRADALVALADGSGRLTCQCGRRDCPHADMVADEPRKPLVQVGVSAETLAGLQDNPALLAGFGAIDAELARQIASHARFQVFPEYEATSAERGESVIEAERGESGIEVAQRNEGGIDTGERDESGIDIAVAQHGEGGIDTAQRDGNGVEAAQRNRGDTAATPQSGGHAGGMRFPPDTSQLDDDIGAPEQSVGDAGRARRLGGDAGRAGQRGGDADLAAQPDDDADRTVTAVGAAAPAWCSAEPGREGAESESGTHCVGGRDERSPTASGSGNLRYRPGARLAARVRALDGVCRAPGCRTPAAAADLDHHVPFDHSDPAGGGHTTEENLSCRCRRHHRLKTLADNGANGWRIRQHPGRRHEWRTPTGEIAITEPEGAPYLFPATPVPPAATIDVPARDRYARSPIDPGAVEAELTELVHVYVPPARRRPRVSAEERVGGATAVLSNSVTRQGNSECPPF